MEPFQETTIDPADDVLAIELGMAVLNAQRSATEIIAEAKQEATVIVSLAREEAERKSGDLAAAVAKAARQEAETIISSAAQVAEREALSKAGAILEAARKKAEVDSRQVAAAITAAAREQAEAMIRTASEVAEREARSKAGEILRAARERAATLPGSAVSASPDRGAVTDADRRRLAADPSELERRRVEAARLTGLLSQLDRIEQELGERQLELRGFFDRFLAGRSGG